MRSTYWKYPLTIIRRNIKTWNSENSDVKYKSIAGVENKSLSTIIDEIRNPTPADKSNLQGESNIKLENQREEIQAEFY